MRTAIFTILIRFAYVTLLKFTDTLIIIDCYHLAGFTLIRNRP